MSEKPEKSKIFYVIGSLLVGGAEKHISMVAPALVKRGYRVVVYNLSGDSVLGDAMADAGVKIVSPPFRLPASRLRFVRGMALAVSSLKLFLLFLFERPPIVHFFLPQAYIVGAIAARCAGLSGLIMSRRSLNAYQAHHPMLARLERRLHRHMRLVIANSKRVLAELRDDEKIPADKLGLIHNGIELGLFDQPFDAMPKRAELGIEPEAKVLVVVANLIPYKGHADLLEALAGVNTELPDDWVLLAVGRDDGIGDTLSLKADGLELADKVSFLGARDDVPDILRVSDIGLLCSHEEGFSNAILEGMAAGLPMIVTDVGGNAEAVVDGTSGIVVPPHAPDDLGRAIKKLVNNPALRKRMGAAGQERVRTHFSLDMCVDKYQKLYDHFDSGYVPEELSGKSSTD
ncbi:MAG: glycosyltransferase [Hyphomicrobiales bacterium]|nr:glycosyltransferase [Hyphomicrobiales bacterium]